MIHEFYCSLSLSIGAVPQARTRPSGNEDHEATHVGVTFVLTGGASTVTGKEHATVTGVSAEEGGGGGSGSSKGGAGLVIDVQHEVEAVLAALATPTAPLQREHPWVSKTKLEKKVTDGYYYYYMMNELISILYIYELLMLYIIYYIVLCCQFLSSYQNIRFLNSRRSWVRFRNWRERIVVH